MTWINGRPDDWINLYGNYYLKEQIKAYEEGASAMLSAVIKWLFEPCKEHPIDTFKTIIEDTSDYTRAIHNEPAQVHYKHRKDCPQCMAELRGEK